MNNQQDIDNKEAYYLIKTQPDLQEYVRAVVNDMYTFALISHFRIS